MAAVGFIISVDESMSGQIFLGPEFLVTNAAAKLSFPIVDIFMLL